MYSKIQTFTNSLIMCFTSYLETSHLNSHLHTVYSYRTTALFYFFLANEEDFCPQFPESNLISLPTGCSANGLREIDVGQCEANPCRRTTDIDDATCADVTTSCCGAATFETVIVSCDDCTVYELTVATSCGCMAC